MAAEQRLTQTERGNLVAYLDGELNEVEARAISTKLTQSVSARREAEALRKTWELLEYLPRPTATPQLAQQTLTEIARLGQGNPRLAGLAGRVVRFGGRAAACLLTAAVTLALGYAGARWLWPDPSARLARQLSLAEHLDEYEEIGTFEFLQQLDESPVLQEGGE